MATKLFLRDGVIQLRINSGIRGRSRRLSTGVSVATGMQWDDNRQRLVGKGQAVINANARLSEIEAYASRAISRHDDVAGACEDVRHWMETSRPRNATNSKSLYLLDYMGRKINDMRSGALLSANRTRYSDNTIRTYRGVMNIYRRYCNIIGTDIDLYSIDLGGKDVNIRQIAKDRSVRYFTQFIDYMVREGMKPNAQQSITGVMAVFLGMAEKELSLILDKSFRVPGEEFPIVVAPVAFYKDFLNDRQGMYASFDPNDKTRYEIAAIIMLSTLRISDVVALKPGNFIPVEGGAELVVVNQKTRKRTVGLISTPVWEKIRANIETRGSVFSSEPTERISDPRHMFSHYHELQEPRTVHVQSPDRSKILEITKPLWEWLSPHALRRTAITTMLALGMNDRQIKHLSGHRGDSRSFEKYVSFTEATQKAEVSRFQDKIFNQGDESAAV